MQKPTEEYFNRFRSMQQCFGQSQTDRDWRKKSVEVPIGHRRHWKSSMGYGHFLNFWTINGHIIYLYIYKIVAILFLWTQTPPTILVIEGWNLGTNPPIVGGRPLTNFFEIGPRVPRLGPNFGQNLNKIAITREPLGRFGWNLDWRDIFKLYYHLNSMVKALKSTGIEIMVAQNT